MAWLRPRVAEEAEQGRVDLVGVGPGDAVRTALDDDEVHVRDEAGQPLAGLVERQDPVGVTLDNQHRDIDLGLSARKSACQVVTHSTTAIADIPTATLKLAL